jgi:DNA (cytosine-5)-methyltransferase 1
MTDRKVAERSLTARASMQGTGRMTADVQSTEQQRPVAISCFSGAMGLDRGLEEAGFSVRLAVEIDEDARATVKANRPHLPVLDDVRQLTAALVRERAGVDTEIGLVAGGSPCQS